MRKNNRLFTFIITITLIIFLLTGCWDSRDFDKMTLISAIGVDTAREKNQIKYTVQLVSNSSGENGNGGNSKAQSVTKTASVTGNTIFEASSNLVKQIGNPPFYGHNDIIIIGEEIARQGIKPYIDFFMRNHKIRANSKILIAKEKASEILDKSHYQEMIPAKGLEYMIENASMAGTVICMNLMKFYMKLNNDKIEPVATRVELQKGDPESNDAKSKNEKNLLHVNGGAIFRGDKLMDWLNNKEARGYNWIKNPADINGPVIVNTKPGDNNITIKVIKTKAKIVPEFAVDNTLNIKIQIETNGVIMENMDENIAYFNESTINILEKRFAQVIKNEIISCLHKSQKYKTDILGFAEIVYKKYPEKYKIIKNTRENIYVNLPVELNIKTCIERTGMIN